MSIFSNSALILATQLFERTTATIRRFRTKKTARIPFIEGIREFCSDAAVSKYALLSFSPSAWLAAMRERPDIRYFNISGLTYEVTKALNEKGYSVDIVDSGVPDFKPSRKYDLYLGHAANTRTIIENLSPGTFVLHYASGPYWREFSRMSQERYDQFSARKGLPQIRTFVRSISGAEEGEEFLITRADAGFSCGPRMVAGYRGASRNMSLLYFGSYVEKDLLVENRDFEAGRKNFIYVAGTGGNIQKGLDLLIEAFARMPELNLYIYCKVEKEVSSAYRRELALPNIHYVYHYSHKRLRHKMRALLERINFTITAPIDIGPGTAFVGSMGLGLIPVGYSDIEAEDTNSVLVDSFRVEDLMAAARRASDKSAAWCKQASRETLERFQRLHYPPQFGRNFKAYIGNLGL